MLWQNLSINRRRPADSIRPPLKDSQTAASRSQFARRRLSRRDQALNRQFVKLVKLIAVQVQLAKVAAASLAVFSAEAIRKPEAL